ncbi:putative periplasmic protein [Klebsiella pneumoniae]|uniref:Putative periplasmic protein n=1 Tax=Klebsiella pneumoniae TaxID=573 RepID=A0A3S4GKG8_KLEPN|nr:putative periplasmic protein [Klebsiella pneumoniae]
MAEDSDTGRLFVTDNSKAKTTLVLDIHSGKLLKQLDVGDSLAVQFNKKRHEIYISQRESGKVISLDASRYTLKKSWALSANPQQLAAFPPMVRRCLSPSNSPSIKTTPLKARTASYVST